MLRGKYFNYMAKGLVDAAKLQKDPALAKDSLMGDLSHSFIHRKNEIYEDGPIPLVQKNFREMFGKDDELNKDTTWIPDTIERMQKTWLQTHDTLPVDFTKYESAPEIVTLMRALGKLERRAYNKEKQQSGGGERGRG